MWQKEADVTEKKVSHGCLQPDIVSASFWGHLQQSPFTKNNTTQTYLLTDKDLDFIQQTLIRGRAIRMLISQRKNGSVLILELLKKYYYC